MGNALDNRKLNIYKTKIIIFMRYYRLVKNNTYKIKIVNSQIDNSIRITESSEHTQIREEKCHWMITVCILF